MQLFAKVGEPVREALQLVPVLARIMVEAPGSGGAEQIVEPFDRAEVTADVLAEQTWEVAGLGRGQTVGGVVDALHHRWAGR